MPYTTEDFERDLSDDNKEGRTESITITLPNISWPQLRAEKYALTDVYGIHLLSDTHRTALEGLLNFLDAVQDAAEVEMGEVFAKQHIFQPSDMGDDEYFGIDGEG